MSKDSVSRIARETNKIAEQRGEERRERATELIQRFLYDENGEVKLVLLADGKLLKPKYASWRLVDPDTVNATVRVKNLTVAGLVLLNDPPLFEPHPTARYFSICPSWHNLEHLVSYDYDAIVAKVAAGIMLTPGETDYLSTMALTTTDKIVSVTADVDNESVTYYTDLPSPLDYNINETQS